MPVGIRQALAIPANNRHGSIEDIEHIVVLMQENRAFDHYFGTLRGVRGYGDEATVALKNGKTVFHQPLAASVGEVLPFHPTTSNLGRQFIQDLSYDWVTGQAAFKAGRYDGWVPAKGTTTMAYLRRDDIRSTIASPTPSRSATRITARPTPRPIRTATTCGPATSATTARAAAR